MTRVSLLRQRLPFFALLLSAVAGIVAGGQLPLPAWAWMVAAAGCAWSFFRWQRGFFLLVVTTFATLHLWQSGESPAARFADWIGSRVIPAIIDGRVASEPLVYGQNRHSYQLQVSRIDVEGRSITPSIRLQVEAIGDPPRYGETVQMRGSLQSIAPPRNPGQFAFDAWLARRGIHTRVIVNDALDTSVLRPATGFSLQRLATTARNQIRSTLTAGINDPAVSDLLVAMVLGDTSEMPERLQEQFRGTGTFHLFSVSGLHVGMIAVLLWYLLRVPGLSRRQAALLIIPLLFFYALMTGWKPASIRAAIMTSVVLCGFLANRRPILLNNLCAAAFIILLGDTNQLGNAGFQLSFSVVATILLLAVPLTRLFERPFSLDPFFPEKLLLPGTRYFLSAGRKVAALAAVSAAAWAGSLPLTVGYFHLISLSALPANLLAVPMAFGVMAVAMLSLLAGCVSTSLAVIFNQTNWLLANTLLSTISFFASLPGSYVYVGLPKSPQAEIVVFDFSGGGANWLKVEDQAWLIDCGPLFYYDTTLLAFLRSQGRRSLDGLILTHGDVRHIGASPELLATCPPERIVESALSDRSPHRHRFHELLVETGRPKSLHRAGDVIALSPNAKLHVLYPPTGHSPRVADNKTLILRLDVGTTRILFLSDAGLATEQWLVENVPSELDCDILVKGIPRAGPTLDSAFLAAASPMVVVATAATFPQNERFPPELEKELGKRGIRLFRQDQTGAVTIRIFPKHWEVSAFLDARSYSHRR